MKKNVLLFADGVYMTPTGNDTKYLHDVALCAVMGQGDRVWVHYVVNGNIPADCTITLTPFHSARPEPRPSAMGASFAPIQVTASGLSPIQGPFAGCLDVVLTISDSQHASHKAVSLEVWATVDMGA